MVAVRHIIFSKCKLSTRFSVAQSKILSGYL